MSVFKDFQCLENLEKNSRAFKDWHEPCISVMPCYPAIRAEPPRTLNQ